jgi:ketosteroid isomerase-like protein
VTPTPGTVVRALFERIAPLEDSEGVRELLAPDVVWYGTSGGLDAHRVIHGPNEFLDYLQEIEDLWERLNVEIESLIEADTTVVVFLLETARAGRGGPDVRNETAVTFEVRAGKIVEARGYLDRSEALEAAGIRE